MGLESVVDLHAGHLQATLSKLLTYCTQSSIFNGMGNE